MLPLASAHQKLALAPLTFSLVTAQTGTVPPGRFYSLITTREKLIASQTALSFPKFCWKEASHIDRIRRKRAALTVGPAEVEWFGGGLYEMWHTQRRINSAMRGGCCTTTAQMRWDAFHDTWVSGRNQPERNLDQETWAQESCNWLEEAHLTAPD